MEDSHCGVWRQHRYRYSWCLSSSSSAASVLHACGSVCNPHISECPEKKQQSAKRWATENQQCRSEFTKCFVTCHVNSEINSLLFCLSPAGAAYVSLPQEWAAAPKKKKRENHITQNDPMSLHVNATLKSSMWALTTAINNTERHLISGGGGNQMCLLDILSILWLCEGAHMHFKGPVVV